jgi:hypothetical protein
MVSYNLKYNEWLNSSLACSICARSPFSPNRPDSINSYLGKSSLVSFLNMAFMIRCRAKWKS